MKRNITFKFSLMFLTFLVCLTGNLFAGPTNGNFASGLDGWNHEFGNVNAVGGVALFQEHNTEFSSTLSQVFTLDADSWMLSFDITMTANQGGSQHIPNWEDTFTASLLDPVTYAPLASNPTYTDFYYHDRGGVVETIAVVSGNTVSLDVSALAGQSVFLSFDLFGSNDGYLTTVTIDDVKVSSTTPVVPVPGALLLGLAGTGIVGYFRRSRRLISFVILFILLTNINSVLKAEVICVPWQPSNQEIAHYTYNGKEITLKGIARGPMTQYRWDFGDSTSTNWTAITNPYILEAKHTYNGTVGQLFIATLYGRDAQGNETTDKYPVRIYDSTDIPPISIKSHLDVRVNIAVDEALWYLHKSMARSTFGNGQPYGYFSSNQDRLATTGAAVDAFQLHGSKANMDYDSDPYVETVQRALNYILSRCYVRGISNQTYGNPDSNGNGIGITPHTNTYIGGIAMVALASSGAPNRIAQVGPANVVGRTYADIVQDMVDYWAWGQNTYNNQYRGGWRYAANQSSADMSTTQWPILGMLAAKENMGSTVPQFVYNELPNFLNYAQHLSNNEYSGGFGYTSSSTIYNNHMNDTKTGAGIICHHFLGTSLTDPRIQKAMGYLYRHWNDAAGSWHSQRLLGSSYAMYAVMKAMRIPDPDITKIKEYDYVNGTQTGNEFDWYYATNQEPREGFAHYLVRTQQTNGSWDDVSVPPRLYDAFATGWRVLILLKGVSIIPPEAVVSNLDDMEFDLNQPIPLDAGSSFHPDKNRQIVSYEWDFTYDGEVFVADATGPVVTIANGFPATGHYPVALRVTDDNPENLGGPQSSLVAFDVYVHPPCHDPHALITGPYNGWIGIPVNFDASQSWDPDSTNLTFAWDMDNDGLYGSEDHDCFGRPSDATGPKPQWTWDAPYSGGIGLKVSDDGCYTNSEHYTGSDFVHTTVHVGNHAPVSNPGGPYYAYPGSTIQLDAGLSYDTDPGDSVTYAWDLDNDGQFDDSTDRKPSFTVGDTVDHVYDICLKVTDQYGEYDIKCTTVTTTVLVVMTEISPGRIDFDRRTGQFCIEISAKNISGQTMEGPIWLVIENISYASITLANPDGTTSDGKQYIDMSDVLGDNPLAPDQIITKRICFSNPDRLRFNFTVSLYSMSGLEEPPMAPRSEKVAVGDTVQGDITGEGAVDVADLKIMMRDWLQGDSPADVYPEFGDGIVDIKDFALLAENWLEGTPNE